MPNCCLVQEIITLRIRYTYYNKFVIQILRITDTCIEK